MNFLVFYHHNTSQSKNSVFSHIPPTLNANVAHLIASYCFNYLLGRGRRSVCTGPFALLGGAAADGALGCRFGERLSPASPTDCERAETLAHTVIQKYCW